MATVTTDIGNGIEIEYDLDWSGDAVIRWLEGATQKQVAIPGNVCLYLLSSSLDTPANGEELIHRFTEIEKSFQVLRRQASFLKAGLEGKIALIINRLETLENASTNGQ